MPEEIWDGVFKNFARALKLMDDLTGESDDGGDVDDLRLSANCDLYFAKDFSAALAQRQAKRKEDQA